MNSPKLRQVLYLIILTLLRNGRGIPKHCSHGKEVEYDAAHRYVGCGGLSYGRDDADRDSPGNG